MTTNTKFFCLLLVILFCTYIVGALTGYNLGEQNIQVLKQQVDNCYKRVSGEMCITDLGPTCEAIQQLRSQQPQ